MTISNSKLNMQMSGDSSTNIPSTTNFTESSVPINTTSSVPIIIAVVAIFFLISLVVCIVLIITFHKRFRITKHCSDLFNTTKIENCPETEKSLYDYSHHKIGDECNFDTYAQVLEKKLEKSGRKSVAPIHNDPDPTQLYAKVDTARKKKKLRAVEASSPDISEMYAVVNKKAKQHQNKGELNGNQDSSELYSVVDKTKKKKNLSNDNKDTKELLYSVVSKVKIKEGEQEVSQL